MVVFSQLAPPSTTVSIAPSFHPNRRYSRRNNNRHPITTTTTFFPPPTAAATTITLKAHSYNPKRNFNPDKFKLPISIPPLPPIVKKNLLKATIYGAAANLLFFLLQGGGGGSNNAGKLIYSDGGGGGGGWKNADFLSRLFTVQKLDKEEGSELESESEKSQSKSKTQFYRVGSPVYMLGNLRKYQISDVLFFDKRLGEFTDPTEDALFAGINLLPGQVYTKSQLRKELENLTKSGLFEEIDVDCKRNRDDQKTLRLRISFLERTWSGPAERMKCINVGSVPNWNPTVEIIPNKKVMEAIGDEYDKRVEAAERKKPCLLPESLQEEISERMRRAKEKTGGAITARLLAKVKDRVEKWYSDNGYACAQVVSFGKLDSDEVVCEVAEGDIAGVQIIGGGSAAVEEVERVLPVGLRKGEVFNIDVAEQAKLSIDSLGSFCNTEIDLGLDEKNGGGVLVKFKVEEKVKE